MTETDANDHGAGHVIGNHLAVTGKRVQIHAVGLRDVSHRDGGAAPPGRIRVRMSYTQCPRCGHKALSVATQCPHCGVPFETRHSYEGGRPRPRGTLVVLLVVLGVVVLGVDLFRREPGAARGKPAASPTAAATDSIRQPEPAAAPVAPEESDVRGVNSLPPGPPRPPSEAAPAPAGAQERRYANIWVNVRRARRPSAAVVKVLRPAEPVLVDSLSQGWYRVVVDGQGVGYVYRGFVDAAPAAGH